jgi:hypothetical protein
MNRTRIIGIIALLIGVGINFIPENDGIGFISGFLIGGGVIMLLTGQIGRKKKNQMTSEV